MAPPRATVQAQDPFDDWEQAYDTAPPLSRPTPSSNAQLWEAPAYIPVPGSSRCGSSNPTYGSIQQPPQPQMTILKRPSSATSSQGPGSQSGASSSNAPSTKTLAQREQEYRDARARIFGDDAPAAGPAASEHRNSSNTSLRKEGTPPSRTNSPAASCSSPSNPPPVKPTRTPQGPTRDGSKGFANRRKPKAP